MEWNEWNEIIEKAWPMCFSHFPLKFSIFQPNSFANHSPIVYIINLHISPLRIKIGGFFFIDFVHSFWSMGFCPGLRSHYPTVLISTFAISGLHLVCHPDSPFTSYTYTYVYVYIYVYISGS